METKIAIGSFADFFPLIYEFVKCSGPIARGKLLNFDSTKNLI